LTAVATAARDLLSDLTEPQRAAATHVDGPLLIVAAAGSGKTRVITRRVAYLISLGIPASSILALTFTNKAAGEMKERIGKAVDRPVRDFGRLDQPWPTICTFHSLCLRILRHYAPAFGLPSNFSIYDSADQTRVVKEALKQLEMSTTNFPPGSMHSAIGNAKNRLQTAEAFAAGANDFYSKNVARVYRKYQEILATNGALDFDDLLVRTVLGLRDRPDVLAELQQRFQYILIDEYQDTNHAQYVLAHVLAMKHRNVCVVGDPDQSIYAWRGADIQNILDFEKDYADAKVVKLEQNYRSTKTILAIAGQLIARNTQRKDKALWTENPDGAKAELVLCQDEHDEADVVARRLKALREKGNYSWDQMAIFYRMNSLSRVMEDALRKLNLPYVIARGVEFYNRKEIKDVLAYLRAIANPADEISLTRIVNTPARGISDASVKLLSAQAVGHGVSLFEAMRLGATTELTSRAANSVKAFVQLMEGWRRPHKAADVIGGLLDTGEVAPKGSVQSLMEDVVRRSGLEAYYKKEGGEEQSELANIDQLITSAAEFDREHEDGTLDEYLSMVSLVSDADHMKGNGGAITMMTLHAAKGLEFPVVAMIGLEEGCLPHARARESMADLEEERRLCFVGITRAQERLILTKAGSRMIRGITERTVTSPFLAEMPADRLETTDRTSVANYGGGGGFSAVSRTPTKYPRLKKGVLVRHAKFGLGRIAEIDESPVQAKAVVDFNAAGRKTLILEYAKLEPVG
jgi:DNA helicase-2/ATP-dependent DNA helicase PcrA